MTDYTNARFPFSHRLLPVILFGLSFSLLTYEVVLIRILAYLQWYHFAYLVISLALLGFGASGTLLHLFRPFWHRHLESALIGACLLTGLIMAGGKPLLAVIPMDSFLAVWQPWQLGWLVLLCLLLFLPFLFGAFGLILVFSAAPGRIGLYYGANLVGSGTGALGGLLLLYRWHPLDIPPLLGLLTGMLGVLLVVDLWRHEKISRAGISLGSSGQEYSPVNKTRLPFNLALALASVGVIALLAWAIPTDPRMSPYKSLSRARLMPDTEVLLERPSALGVLTIVEGPTLRSAIGLSFSYPGIIRPQPMAFLDGNSLGALPLLDDTSATAALRHVSFALPYRIRPFSTDSVASGRVLVLNAGPGLEVQQALLEGANAVIAVERHRRLIQGLNLLAEEERGPRTVYHQPQVHVVVTEPRSFLYRDTSHYDVVVLPAFGGIASASASMEAVYENYLLTVEGVAAMVDRLSPEGLLCASTWLDTPPRRPLKLFGLMAAALRTRQLERAMNGDPDGLPPPEAKAGESPSRNFGLAAIRSWNLVTVLLSRRPWSPRERDRIRQFAYLEGFDLLFLPGAKGGPPEATFHQLADTTLTPTLVTLAEAGAAHPSLRSPFHLTPPTDNRPFFSHFLTLRSLPVMRHTLGTEGFLLTEWGYVLVWITLALLAVGGGLFILVPLWLYRRFQRPSPQPLSPPQSKPLSLLYFGAIGGGFMFVEILLIQKAVLVLGDPVYAVSAVITALLVFAGVGSILSARFPLPAHLLVPGAVALIGLLLAALAGALSYLAPAWAALGTGGRFVTVIAALAPLGLVMGVFFPTGVRWLKSTRSDQLIPWAWGINGFGSVVTPPLATLAALNLGFPVVGLLGVGCYLVAAAGSLRRRVDRAPTRAIPMTNTTAKNPHG